MKNTHFKSSLVCFLFVLFTHASFAVDKPTTDKPLRVGIVGLIHAHVHWILGYEGNDIEIVGIAEPNRDLAERLCKQYNIPLDLVFDSVEEMLAASKPEVVSGFNTTFDHLKLVQACAPKGIHVMVEKPLAVNNDHAQQMIALAEKHDIQLLTNYETSWYGSNAKAYKIIKEEDKIGDIRRIVFHTGHPGPIEIGCNIEFLDWLTDPVLNGGGALMDFGCYGANLATWLMGGEQPLTVSCVTQQIKPDKYPKVEDEATIILTYPKTQVIIQASWNWSHNVKSMQVYGKTGYVICENGTDMKILENEKLGSYPMKVNPLGAGFDNPFSMLHNVVRNGYNFPAFDPSSTENNEIVVRILDAAKHAAQTGQAVIWKDYYK
jgi:predicted dehydrogenase